jgi:DnaJ-class molecular chaperone
MSQLNIPTFAPETCAWCQGRWVARPEDRCQVCRGKGAVLVAQPAAACVACAGSGRAARLETTTKLRCAQCTGTGWTHAKLNQSSEHPAV